MKAIRVTGLSMLLVLMAACQSLGIETATSFDQKLAYGYGTYTAVVKSADVALTSGSLTVDEAKQVQELAKQARPLLDSAKVIEDAGDPAAANNKLVLATAILSELQTYLNSRRK